MCNHVSLIDSFVVSASTSRMIRYFIFRPYLKYTLLRWYFRVTHAIPIAEGDSKESIEEALESAGR